MTDASAPKLILVTNDDGFDAEGILALFHRLSRMGETYLVAPDREKSATSLALTLRSPLRVRPAGRRVFAVEGTPADCVYLAVEKLLPRRPDLVASGINHGPNLGQQDISYSGTVAGAVQGTFFGVPSLAVSALHDGRGRYDFALAAELAARVAARLLAFPTAGRITLNLNVPPPPLKGLRLTRLGWKEYFPEIIEAEDPRRRSYYWIGMGKPKADEAPDTDLQAVREGYASLTPLHSDATHHESLRLPDLKKLEEEGVVPETDR
jgi:5'-nucleotidase